MNVMEGCIVSVEYTGTLENGDIFDSNVGKDPLKFVVGKHEVIKGFEDAVIGMEEGQEKEFLLMPEQAYGAWKQELVKDLDLKKIRLDKKVKVGDIIGLQTKQGFIIPAKILHLGKNIMQADLNHPLAGKVLKFKIKVVKIEPQ